MIGPSPEYSLYEFGRDFINHAIVTGRNNDNGYIIKAVEYPPPRKPGQWVWREFDSAGRFKAMYDRPFPPDTK